MGGLLDLLFLGILVYFVLRGVGRATERGGGPAERAPPSRPRPGTEAAGASSPASGPERLRDRLMEELRKWEAEHSSRAEGLEPPAAGRSPPEATAPAGREEVFTYDEAVEEAAPVRAVPSPVRPLPEPEPARPDRLRVAPRTGEPLDLGRLTPFQRAVVWREILGTPAGLRR